MSDPAPSPGGPPEAMTPPGWTPPGAPGPPGSAPGPWAPYAAPHMAPPTALPSAPPWGPQWEPQWGPPGGGGWAAPVHKPGIVPLRPLRLGDVYDGAFKAIRQNPAVMVGMSVVVVTGFLLVPALGSALLALTGGLADPLVADPASGTGSAELSLATLMTYAGQLSSGFAGLLLSGLLVHVVAQAVLGRRAGAGETWRAVRGRLLPLIGLTIVAALMALLPLLLAAGAVGAVWFLTEGPVATVLTGLVTVPLAVVLVAYLQVRLVLLASPALVLERVGIVAAMRRANTLSRGQFWRILGIYLLTSLVVGFAGGLLAMPFSMLALLGGLLADGTLAGVLYIFGTYLGIVITQSLTTPFTSAVTSLLYVDQRIRKEAFDVELLAAAPVDPVQPTPSTP